MKGDERETYDIDVGGERVGIACVLAVPGSRSRSAGIRVRLNVGTVSLEDSWEHKGKSDPLEMREPRVGTYSLESSIRQLLRTRDQ